MAKLGYDIFDADPSVTLYACMAHARRKFFDCKTYEPDKAAHVLKQIRKLYLIERWLRKTGASADVRQQLRQERAGPVLEELKPWLEVNNGLPKSPWAKATQYTLARWQRLTRYLDEGRVELDNNLVENAIRPLAIGRKNYMFAGSMMHPSGVPWSIRSLEPANSTTSTQWNGSWKYSSASRHILPRT